MRKLVILLSFLFLLTLAGGQTEAGLTGNISGIILDSTGQPLPGVMVTVIGTGLPGARTDYSREDGRYRIVLLPPGKYELQAELSGFKTIEQKNIGVSINETIRNDVTMEISTIEEVVIVTADTPVMDTGISTVGVNIERDFTERLPGNDSFQAAFSMGGGTFGLTGNPHVHGATHTDNLVLYDGVDATDPTTGTFASNLNADAIEEVEVQTGGFSAEYGKAMGGIVNAVTKTGGNAFEGIFRLKYSTDQFNADADPGKPDVVVEDNYEPTISFGGPILKDKLWFFLSYRRNERDNSKEVRTYRDPDTDEYTLASVDDDQLWQYLVGKVTWSINPANNVELSFSSDPAMLDNNEDLTYSPEAQESWEQGGLRYGLNWTYIHSSNLYFDTKYGFFNSYIYIKPMDDSGVSSVWDRRSRIWYENYNITDDNDRSKWSFSTAATYIKENWKGTHEFRTGLEYQVLEDSRDLNYTTGTYYATDWYGTDQEQRFERYNYVNPQVDKAKGIVTSAFLQDNWEMLPGFHFNLGIRFDRAEYENKEGTTVHTFDAMIAPRLGVSWDLSNDGKSKIYANIGRYYSTFDLGLVAMNPGPSTLRQTWRYDPSNENADDEGYYLFSYSGGEETRDMIDPDLKPEYADELIVGYDQEIMSNWSVGTRFVMKQTRDIIEDVGFWEDENGNYHLATDVDINDPDAVDNWYEHWTEQRYMASNPSDCVRDYWGIELDSSARTDKFAFEVSYTYSETTGTTYNTQPGNYFTNTSTHFSVYYDTPMLSHNIEGPLFYDLPHLFKVFGSYNLPWGFVVGATATYKSGYIYEKYGDHGAGPDGEFDTEDDIDHQDPAYGPGVTLPEGRGEYRMPGNFNLALSLQKDFELGKWGVITAIIDARNVLDDQYVVTRVEDEGPDHGQASQWATPRTVTFQLKYAF